MLKTSRGFVIFTLILGIVWAPVAWPQVLRERVEGSALTFHCADDQRQALAEPAIWMHVIGTRLQGFQLRQAAENLLNSWLGEPFAMTDIGISMPLRRVDSGGTGSDAPRKPAARRWKDALEWMMAPDTEDEIRAVLAHQHDLLADVLFVRRKGGVSTTNQLVSLLASRYPDRFSATRKIFELSEHVKAGLIVEMGDQDLQYAKLMEKLRQGAMAGQGISLFKLERNGVPWNSSDTALLHRLEQEGMVKSFYQNAELIRWRILPKGDLLISMVNKAQSRSPGTLEGWSPPEPPVLTGKPGSEPVSPARVEQVRAAYRAFRKEFPGPRIPATRVLDEDGMPTERSLSLIERHMSQVRDAAMEGERRTRHSIASPKNVAKVLAEWNALKEDYPGAPSVPAVSALNSKNPVSIGTLHFVTSHIDRTRKRMEEQIGRARDSIASAENVARLREEWKSFKEEFPNASFVAAASALENGRRIYRGTVVAIQSHMRNVRKKAKRSEDGTRRTLASIDQVTAVLSAWKTLREEYPSVTSIPALSELERGGSISVRMLNHLVQRHIDRQRKRAVAVARRTERAA